MPVSTWGSSGCLLFFVRLERFLELDRAAYVWLLDARWPLIAVITYAFAAMAAVSVGLRMGPRFAPVRWRAQDCTWYWVGASICCGSFVGANLAYRWIFVLLAVPLLIRAAGVPDRVVATWSRLTLVAIAMSLLAPLRADRVLFLATQFANWSCILLLIAGCAALRRAVTLDFLVRTPAPVCPARNPAHALTFGCESVPRRGISENEPGREVSRSTRTHSETESDVTRSSPAVPAPATYHRRP